MGACILSGRTQSGIVGNGEKTCQHGDHQYIVIIARLRLEVSAFLKRSRSIFPACLISPIGDWTSRRIISPFIFLT